MLKETSNATKAAMLSIVVLGATTLAASTLFMSSFFATVGFSLIFWGAVLLYITPTGNDLLGLINAASEASSANIERILTEYNLSQQGLYLPTENKVGLFNKLTPLESAESVLIFFPTTQISQKSTSRARFVLNGGLYINPPGEALCKMIERKIGRSFSTIDLQKFTKIMPIILTKYLKLAETVEIRIEQEIITVDITNNILEKICQETSKKPKTHKQVGCLLSSAIACALTKVSGKPIALKNEICDVETNTTKVKYQIMSDIGN